jgi:tripartite-type tricarboxylate transporter receptor subunit TctC
MQVAASEGEQAMMRGILGWIVAGTALAFSGSVLGESYPSRPVTLIVPYAAGGGVDAVARVIAESLSERLGQRFVIENVTGAGGVIGTQRAARAQADGYTLLFAVENTMAVAKLVQPTVVQYDSQKDFQPISLIGTAPLVLAGKKDLPANNIAELMTLLKANPGKYSFASSGVGTSLHVLGEMINVEGKVKMVHVPYRAAPQIVTDLISNQIDLAILPLNLALPSYRNGSVKIFGTSERTRSPLAPDLPSLAEHPDLKGVNMTVWYGLFAPAGIDSAIVARISGVLATVLRDATMRAKLADVHMINAVGSTPAELAAFLAQEIETYSAIVKAANIKAE